MRSTTIFQYPSSVGIWRTEGDSFYLDLLYSRHTFIIYRIFFFLSTHAHELYFSFSFFLREDDEMGEIRRLISTKRNRLLVVIYRYRRRRLWWAVIGSLDRRWTTWRIEELDPSITIQWSSKRKRMAARVRVEWYGDFFCHVRWLWLVVLKCARGVEKGEKERAKSLMRAK